MDTIINFLKGRFSVMGGPMDMIFGVFSETYKRLLESIISQLISKYNKSYNNLNVKVAENSTALNKKTGRVEAAKYKYLIELYENFLEGS